VTCDRWRSMPRLRLRAWWPAFRPGGRWPATAPPRSWRHTTPAPAGPTRAAGGVGAAGADQQPGPVGPNRLQHEGPCAVEVDATGDELGLHPTHGRRITGVQGMRPPGMADRAVHDRPLRRHRQHPPIGSVVGSVGDEVAGRQRLELRQQPLRASGGGGLELEQGWLQDPVDPGRGVPAGPPIAHLDQPRPDPLRWGMHRHPAGPLHHGVGDDLVARQGAGRLGVSQPGPLRQPPDRAAKRPASHQPTNSLPAPKGGRVGPYATHLAVVACCSVHACRLASALPTRRRYR
jgi:hypothetical protein